MTQALQQALIMSVLHSKRDDMKHCPVSFCCAQTVNKCVFRVQPVEMMGTCTIKVPADNCTHLISLRTSSVNWKLWMAKVGKVKGNVLFCFTVQSLEKALLRCGGELWPPALASWLVPCSPVQHRLSLRWTLSNLKQWIYLRMAIRINESIFPVPSVIFHTAR